MKTYLIAIMGAAYSMRKLVYMFLITTLFIGFIAFRDATYYVYGESSFFSEVEFFQMFLEIFLFQVLLYSVFFSGFLIKFSLENIKKIRTNPEILN